MSEMPEEAAGLPESLVTPKGAPSGPAPSRPGLSTGGLLTAIVGAAVVLGMFLPWLTASGPFDTVTETGVRIGAWGTLLLGALGLVRGAARITGRLPASGFIRVNPLITGGLLGVLMMMRWGELQDWVRAGNALPGVSAGFGIGLWAEIAGIAALVAGGLLIRARGE